MSTHKVLSCQICSAEVVTQKLEGALCGCGSRAFSHVGDVELPDEKPKPVAVKPAAEPAKVEKVAEAPAK